MLFTSNCIVKIAEFKAIEVLLLLMTQLKLVYKSLIVNE